MPVKAKYSYTPPPAGSPAEIRRAIEETFERWNKQAGEIVVTDWDLPMVRNGRTAAEVVFYLRERKIPVTVDKWGDFAVNLKCALLIIDSMRLNEARGSLEAAAVAYAATTALVSVEDEEAADLRRAYALFQVRPDADLEVIETVYRRLVNAAHPDKPGGSEAKTRELNAAIEAIRKSRPGR